MMTEPATHDSLTPCRCADGPAFIETMEADSLLAELSDAVNLPAEPTPTADPCLLCGSSRPGVVLDHNRHPVHPQCHSAAHTREAATILSRALDYVLAVAAVYGLLTGVDLAKVTNLADNVTAAVRSESWDSSWL